MGLVSWVERDGFARTVLLLLGLTTLCCFSYSWGYYEGFYNARVLVELEKAHPTVEGGVTPDPTQAKAHHTTNDAASLAVNAAATQTRAVDDAVDPGAAAGAGIGKGLGKPQRQRRRDGGKRDPALREGRLRNAGLQRLDDDAVDPDTDEAAGAVQTDAGGTLHGKQHRRALVAKVGRRAM